MDLVPSAIAWAAARATPPDTVEALPARLRPCECGNKSQYVNVSILSVCSSSVYWALAWQQVKHVFVSCHVSGKQQALTGLMVKHCCACYTHHKVTCASTSGALNACVKTCSVWGQHVFNKSYLCLQPCSMTHFLQPCSMDIAQPTHLCACDHSPALVCLCCLPLLPLASLLLLMRCRPSIKLSTAK